MKKSRLVVGVDVPWVTSWTDEPVIGVRPCLTVKGRPALVQAENAGYGYPQYSKNRLVRQRLTVLKMLCPMCGTATPHDDRWTQVARVVSAGQLRRSGKVPDLTHEIEDKGLVVDAGSIAPLHKACVDLSLAHCPHLKADPHVNVMPFPSRWAVLPLMIQAAPTMERPAAPPVAGAVAVITFLQLIGITGRVDRDWRFRKSAYA